MTGLRLRALLAAVLAAAAVGVWSGPASAHATVSIKTPGPGEVLTADTATVTAQVVRGTHPTSETTSGKVDMKVEQVGTNRADIRASASPDGGGNVAFPLNLPYNGRYRVSVSTVWNHTGLVVGAPDSGTSTDGPRDFSVLAPPANPTSVAVSVDGASRAVTVTWKANTEPDLLFYVVQRAKGESTDFTVLGKVTEPKFVDASTAEAGGSYHYQVVAVRNGIEEGKGISSDPSSLTPQSTAAVPDPPAPPTTTAAAGSSGTTVVAGTGSTAERAPATTLPANSPGALTTSGTVDLKGFTAVQSQARRSVPRPVEPDTGFQSTLPFAPRPDGEEEVEEGGDLGEVAADSPQFRELGDGEESADRQQTMAFFAAGLLATVLLMHVMWVKSEVKRVPLEAVAPEGPRPMAQGRLTGSLPTSEWFIPDRLGMDEARPEREKVTSGA